MIDIIIDIFQHNHRMINTTKQQSFRVRTPTNIQNGVSHGHHFGGQIVFPRQLTPAVSSVAIAPPLDGHGEDNDGAGFPGRGQVQAIG